MFLTFWPLKPYVLIWYSYKKRVFSPINSLYKEQIDDASEANHTIRTNHITIPLITIICMRSAYNFCQLKEFLFYK